MTTPREEALLRQVESLEYQVEEQTMITERHKDIHNKVCEERDALKAQAEKLSKDWVSVKDELPPFGENVLVQFGTATGNIQHTTATYIDQKAGQFTERKVPTWFITVSSGHRLHTVTHWQSLPPPAEGK